MNFTVLDTVCGVVLTARGLKSISVHSVYIYIYNIRFIIEGIYLTFLSTSETSRGSFFKT